MLTKLLFLFLFPLIVFSQIETSIKLKVAMMQNCVKKGVEGETLFWQTKGKITYSIVNYTDEQNPIFKDLFINQYRELLQIYKKMIVSEYEKDTALYVQTLIRQEDDFRKLLTVAQLQKYSEKLTFFKKNNPQANDSYSSLFFSDELLNEYKTKFDYKK
ncbi:MAG: hypothetical protein H7239_00200 [Flavobacterium sp.]|nr:hypothetical protein [Flavobacterium sp.]